MGGNELEHDGLDCGPLMLCWRYALVVGRPHLRADGSRVLIIEWVQGRAEHGL
jgi:hypothetical protein